MRGLLAGVAMVCACYSPSPHAGSPCSTDHPCPDPLVCSPATATCETTSTAIDAPLGIDAPPDGSLIPDAPIVAPANDLPANATPITASGMITEDITYAHDDASSSNGCGAIGGRDVFFSVHLTAAEVWYFDTFGSTYDTVVRVFPGACVGGPTPAGTVCRNDACGVVQSQFANTLAAGDNCVEVDESGASAAPAMLVLHVERGNRDGTRLVTGTGIIATGNTCAATRVETGSCGGAGRDVGYFTSVCPNVTHSLTASTCNVATVFDTVLYVRGPGSTQLACNNDDSACASSAADSTLTGVSLHDAHLFWLIVDGGSDAACGAYTLTTTLQ